MKSVYHGIIALVIMSVSICVDARSPYREFTDQQGRKIKARVLDYDEKSDIVRIQREDGKTLRVPTSIFSLKDQVYIHDWEYINGFESDQKLRITCEKKVIEKWKKEDWRDIRYDTGDVERELVKTTKYEKTAFVLNFHNTTKLLYENIKVAYVIYYEQSEGGWKDKGTFPMVLKSKYGEIEIKMLIAKSKRSLVTEPVVIYIEEDGDIEWDSDPILAKGKVIGMRARIFLTTANGIQLMREISYPGSLSEEKYPWEEQAY